MNENAKMWVEALRSGEFKQTTGYLKHEGADAYCCLGVACELYRRETGLADWDPDVWEAEDGEEVVGENPSFLGCDTAIPTEVAEWLGLFETPSVLHYSAFINDDGLRDSLENINDDGAPFYQIADLIESEPKGLFDS